MKSYRTVAPSTTIISLAEAKAYIGILNSDTEHDTRLNFMLASDTDFLENVMNQCVVPQTWVQPEPFFPRVIVCERSPVISVSISYYNEDDELTPLDPSEYRVMKANFRCEIISKDGFPNTYDRLDAVLITCVCGYSTIPASIKGVAAKLIAMEDADREGAILNPTSLGIDRFIFANRKH